MRSRGSNQAEVLENRTLLTTIFYGENEANDVIGNATHLPFPTETEVRTEGILGNGNRGGRDVDIYSFHLGAGERLIADIDARRLDNGGQLDPDINTVLRLFSPRNLQIGSTSAVKSDHDGEGPDDGGGVDSYLDYTAAAGEGSGLWYLGVSAYNNIDNEYNPFTYIEGTAGNRPPGARYLSSYLGRYYLFLEVQDNDTTGPSISFGNSVNQPDGEHNWVGWSIGDPSGIAARTVRLLRKSDGAILFENNSANDGSFDLNSLPPDTYVIWASATDNDSFRGEGDRSSSTASAAFTIWDDDTTGPSISFGNAVNQPDGEHNWVGWSIRDPSGIAARSVRLLRKSDGAILFQNNSADSGSFDLNSLPPDTYVIWASATDNDTDWGEGDRSSSTASAEFTIWDDDTAPPSITVTRGALADDGDNYFAWTITDTSGISSASAQILRNGSPIFNGPIGASGRFDLNAYGVGQFQISIQATDADTDWGVADRSTSYFSTAITVTDDDTTPPTITFSNAVDQLDSADNLVGWNITDPSGVASRNVRLIRVSDGAVLFSNSTSASGFFDLNGQLPGTYRIEADATDGDADWSGDAAALPGKSMTFTISDDDLVGPTITLGGSEGTESHTETQEFTWSISDPSGLSQLSVIVTREDGRKVTLYSTTDLANRSGSFNFDQYGVGTFEIVASASDSDTDSPSDTSAAERRRSVVVTNSPPTARAGLDQVVIEGDVVSFDGTASSDPDGEQLRFSWDFGDGNTSTGVSPTHVFADNGTYIVRLTVEDAFGVSSTDELIVTVGNASPKLHADFQPSAPNEGDTMTITATLADPGFDSATAGTQESFTAHIDWGDGTSDTVPVVEISGGRLIETLGLISAAHRYADSGVYIARLTVADDDGGSASIAFEITVGDVSPTIALTGAGETDEGTPFLLTLGAITDPGQDTIAHYTVHWGDGSSDTYTAADVAANAIVAHTYSDGFAARTITVDLTDEDGTHQAAGTLSVLVKNIAPTLVLSGAGEVEEGSPYMLTLGAISDPGDDTVMEYVIDWGDGTSTILSAAYVAANPNVMRTYSDGPGDRTITVSLIDEDGTHQAAGQLLVSIKNVAPTIALTGANAIEEGASYTLNLGAVTDPGTDTVTGYTVNWGDGSYDSYTAAQIATNPSISHVYLDGPAGMVITVDVTDEDGSHFNAGRLELVVVNVEPSVTVDAATVTIAEGGTATTTGAFSDPGADAVLVSASIGTVVQTGSQNGTWSWSFTTADGPTESQIISITATDSDGAVTTTSFSLVVQNVTPTVEAGIGATIVEGSAFTGSGSFTDPGKDSWTALVDYGDGSAAQPLLLNPDKTFELSHVYTDNGVYTVTVTVVDDDGASSSDTLTVIVNNVAPTPTIVSVGDVRLEGSVIEVNGIATDPAGNNDTLRYAWNIFKDGAALPYASGSGVEKTAFSFTPDDNGSYQIVLTVSDEDGGSSTVDGTITVDNVAPSITAGANSVTVLEGQTATLTGAWRDSGTDTVTLSVSRGTITKNLDGTWSWSSAEADDLATVPVTITARDEDGGVSELTFDLTVKNVAPYDVSIAGPATGVRGQTLYYTATFTDLGVPDSHVLTWTIMKDGSTYANGTGSLFSFVPMERGAYTVSVAITDDDGGVGTSSLELAVLITGVLDGTLFVGGSNSADNIHVSPVGSTGAVEVKINGISQGHFTPSDRIVIYGQDGDDELQVTGSMLYSLWAFGGLGNDHLKGGDAGDVLLGEQGDDVLFGGGGRDLLVGGGGADRIVGNADDDILIAGALNFGGIRETEQAIGNVMAEWTSSRSYAERVANLTNTAAATAPRLNGESLLITVDDVATTDTDERTVIDDGAAVDQLTGASGDDWFFFDSEDKALSRSSLELMFSITELDWLYAV